MAGMNSGGYLTCDIIGDPANYYRGQTWTNDGAFNSVEIFPGDVVWLTDPTPLATGITGNFYERTGIQTTFDLAVQYYDDTSYWADLGSSWNGAGSWTGAMANGYALFGTPLLVGEEGENLIPNGVTKPKMSKKVNTLLAVRYSTDKGVTWLNSGITIGTTDNTSSGAITAGNIVLFIYTTYPSTVEPTVNTAVVDMDIGDVATTGSFATDSGSLLSSSLINKVQVGALADQNAGLSALTDYTIGYTSGKLYDGGKAPTHHTNSMTLSSPAVKAFPHKTADGVNLIFKEMKNDGVTWSDHLNDFAITDNVAAITDGDGTTTVLSGIVKTKLKSDLK